MDAFVIIKAKIQELRAHPVPWAPEMIQILEEILRSLVPPTPFPPANALEVPAEEFSDVA